MEKQILQDVPMSERLDYLKNSAEKVEKMTYPLSIDEAELNALKTEFSQDAIELDTHDQVLKEAREAYKLKAKPLKKNMAIVMQKIRTRVEEVTEDVYLIADHESNKMGYYNAAGILVYERPLMQNERQLRIVSKETGTN